RGSPAAKAGIQPGDLLLEIQGRPMRRAREALAALAALPRQQEVTLAVQRAGRRLETRATTISRPK
ncbi:PDZ domain-containing protein, partial [Immundisolibacter sp.]